MSLAWLVVHSMAFFAYASVEPRASVRKAQYDSVLLQSFGNSLLQRAMVAAASPSPFIKRDRSVNDTPANETRARPCPQYDASRRDLEFVPHDAMTNITWSCWNAATITNGSSGCMGVWDSCRDLFRMYLDDCAALESAEQTNMSNNSEDRRDNTSNNTSSENSDDRLEPDKSPGYYSNYTSEDQRSAMTHDFQSFLCFVYEPCSHCSQTFLPIGLAGISSSAGGAWGASSSTLGVKTGSLVGVGSSSIVLNAISVR